MIRPNRWFIMWTFCIGSASARTLEDEDASNTDVQEPAESDEPRRNLWDKSEDVDQEEFVDDVVGTDHSPLEPGPGPWGLHPLDTPVVAGPWRIDRPGTAPTHVNRDGSAREPAPPTALWGPTLTGEEAVESHDPWADHNENAGEPRGRGALNDNFPARILGHEPDALLIELPLLITEEPGDFEPPGYWVVVEIFINNKKVGDQRQLVSANTIAAMGPTHAWIKALVPLPAPQGTLSLRVSRILADGRAVEPLFIRRLRYGR